MQRPNVEVEVEREDGEELEFEVNPYMTVHALKCLIAEEWPIPAVCMQLTAGARVADDAARVSEYVGRMDNVAFKLEESYDGLPAALVHQNKSIKLLAVSALGKVGRRDYGRAIALMSTTMAALDDQAHDIRRAAVDTLAGMAPSGDEAALRLLCARVADHDQDVRLAACEALYQLAERGNKIVGSAIRKHLQCWRGDVRRTAAKALGQLGKRGGEPSIKALCQCFEDTDAVVRTVALESLRRLSSRGETLTLQELAARLEHPRTETKVVVLQALRRFCNKEGDANLVLRVLPLVEDPVAEVRRAAADALAAVSPKRGAEGSKPALRALMLLLGDPLPPEPVAEEDCEVPEEEHSDVDEDVPPPEQEEDLEPPEPPREDEDSGVRRAAVAAVGEVSRVGDAFVILAVTRRLEDSSWEVRRAAAVAVPKVVPKFGFKSGDTVMITAHHHPLVPFSDGKKFTCDDECEKCTRQEEGPTVRWSCRQCLFDMCRGCVDFYRSDKVGLAEVLLRLVHASEDVRLMTVKAMLPIAPEGNWVIVSRLVRCLRRGGVQVKKASMEALLQLGDPHGEAVRELRNAPEPKPKPPPKVEEEPKGKGKGKDKGKQGKGAASAKAAAAKPKAAPPPPPPPPPKEEEEKSEEGEGREEEESSYYSSEEEDETPPAEEAPLPEEDEGDFKEEDLMKLKPIQALDAAFDFARKSVLREVEGGRAELRKLAMVLLERLLPLPGQEGEQGADLVKAAYAAFGARLKDRDESVRSVAVEILERRNAEPPLLAQTNWPLGVRLHPMRAGETSASAASATALGGCAFSASAPPRPLRSRSRSASPASARAGSPLGAVAVAG